MQHDYNNLNIYFVRQSCQERVEEDREDRVTVALFAYYYAININSNINIIVAVDIPGIRHFSVVVRVCRCGFILL